MLSEDGVGGVSRSSEFCISSCSPKAAVVLVLFVCLFFGYFFILQSKLLDVNLFDLKFSVSVLFSNRPSWNIIYVFFTFYFHLKFLIGFFFP